MEHYFDSEGRLCDSVLRAPCGAGYPIVDALGSFGSPGDTDLQRAQSINAVDSAGRLVMIRLVYEQHRLIRAGQVK